jgi:orotate phosphoribosyltransferase
MDTDELVLQRERLVTAIQKAGALKFGKFTLASGGESSYYLDLRRVTLSSHVGIICDAFLMVLDGMDYEAVGGPSSGADPLVGACLASWSCPRGFVVRKEVKDHGTGQLIEGSVRFGDRVVVVEDVTTKGTSLLRAVWAIENFGGTVVQAITVVDRTGLVGPLLEQKKIPFRALLTPRDLGITETSA